MKYFPLTEVKHAPKVHRMGYWDAWFASMENCKTVTIDSETSYARWMREYCEVEIDIDMRLIDGVWVRK